MGLNLKTSTTLILLALTTGCSSFNDHSALDTEELEWATLSNDVPCDESKTLAYVDGGIGLALITGAVFAAPTNKSLALGSAVVGGALVYVGYEAETRAAHCGYYHAYRNFKLHAQK